MVGSLTPMWGGPQTDCLMSPTPHDHLTGHSPSLYYYGYTLPLSLGPKCGDPRCGEG